MPWWNDLVNFISNPWIFCGCPAGELAPGIWVDQILQILMFFPHVPVILPIISWSFAFSIWPILTFQKQALILKQSRKEPRGLAIPGILWCTCWWKEIAKSSQNGQALSRILGCLSIRVNYDQFHSDDVWHFSILNHSVDERSPTTKPLCPYMDRVGAWEISGLLQGRTDFHGRRQSASMEIVRSHRQNRDLGSCRKWNKCRW